MESNQFFFGGSIKAIMNIIIIIIIIVMNSNRFESCFILGRSPKWYIVDFIKRILRIVHHEPAINSLFEQKYYHIEILNNTHEK